MKDVWNAFKFPAIEHWIFPLLHLIYLPQPPGVNENGF